MKDNVRKKTPTARARRRSKQPRRTGRLVPSLVGILILAVIGGIVFATAGRSPSTPIDSGGTLAAGDPAPAFTLPQAGGGKYSLTEDLKEGPVLLYFSMAGQR